MDRDVQPDAVDAAGEVVTGVDLDPGLVNITIPVYENLETRTLPVNPVVTGTPGAGFRTAGVSDRSEVGRVGEEGLKRGRSRGAQHH